MPFEVEIKARLIDPLATEAVAAVLGVFEKEVFKEDIYFRRHGETAPVPVPRYRLRREAGNSIVTFKNRQVDGGVEINDEVEFEVGNAHAFYRFADYIGFEPFVVKRKKSRIYNIGDARVELNEVEHLGHFAEIEMLCDEQATVLIARTQVARLLNRLGLPPDSPEYRSYILLIQEAYPVRYRFIDDPALDWPFEEVK